ncbi:MAG: hypothetical protein GF335_00775 [Candidatus Moranbacteria bacterium]|nr:hypothetical protein [Candidatus Moranbacteria bacterium]
MAKIIYAVQGEGRGHSSRSKIIIEGLLQKGHKIKIISSNKGYAYLSKFFDNVEKIMGLGFVYEKEKVDILKTLQKNLNLGILKGHKSLNLINKLFSEFKPDLVISDFEPFVPFIANLRGVPIISVTHQHLISHCKIDYLHSWKDEYFYADAVTNNMYWFVKHYFVTSFYFPEIKKDYKKKLSLTGPILRKEVFEQKVKVKDHILVYVTSENMSSILDIIKGLDFKFIIYGFEGKKNCENLIFKKPSTKGFLKDLAQCKAVITNGGYSLISEALYYGKPIYSIPIGNQFEQMLNAYYLERMGLGIYDFHPGKQRLKSLIQGLDYFRYNISRQRQRIFENKNFLELLGEKINQFTK